MGRPLTLRGRKPTSSSSVSSSSVGEFRNLLSVLYKVGFCFICNLKLLRKGRGIGGSRSDDLAVLDLSMASDEGWSKIECNARWPSRHARRSCTPPSWVRSSKRTALERSFNGRYPIHQVRHFCYLFNLFISYVCVITFRLWTYVIALIPIVIWPIQTL